MHQSSTLARCKNAVMREAEVCSQLLERCERKVLAKNDIDEPYILTRQGFN